MDAGTLVLVDGWNHFLAAKKCFGYDLARKFPIDRLAPHLAEAAGAGPVNDVIVVMALPDRNRPEEVADFHAWRRKFKKLRNYGVNHDKARFSYLGFDCVQCHSPLSRGAKCPSCGAENQVLSRRREKGADVQLAVRAMDGAWAKKYSALIVLSQDSDFGPMINRIKEIHRDQRRAYRLFSAFPVCGMGHDHRGVPGTRQLLISETAYTTLAASPYTRLPAAQPLPELNGSRPRRPIAATQARPGSNP